MTLDDLVSWQTVPERVKTLLPAAHALQLKHDKAAADTGLLAIASLRWLPEQQQIAVHTPAPISDRLKTAYVNELSPGCAVVFTNTAPVEAGILVKLASFAHNIGDAWRLSNKALGGPTPLSNAIVSGLLLGGLGYGAGTIAEQLFPDTYVERGRFRQPLAIAGLLGGLGIGGMNAGETYRQLNKINPNHGYWQSWITSNNTPIPPAEQQKQSNFGFTPMRSDTGLRAPTIKVDAFNRAVWADASTGYNQTGFVDGYTSPSIAAATTGIVSGIASQARSPIISPATVINGLASAGVGLATANIAGRTLGALAGLTPAAQAKIQDTGMWAGMLHAVIPPLFGAQ
jgi:hypothetical protein